MSNWCPTETKATWCPTGVHPMSNWDKSWSDLQTPVKDRWSKVRCVTEWKSAYLGNMVPLGLLFLIVTDSSNNTFIVKFESVDLENSWSKWIRGWRRVKGMCWVWGGVGGCILRKTLAAPSSWTAWSTFQNSLTTAYSLPGAPPPHQRAMEQRTTMEFSSHRHM